MPPSPSALRLVSMGFVIIIPLIALITIISVLLFWGLGMDRLGGNTIVLAEQAPIAERRLIGLAAFLPPAGLMLYGLWRVMRMCLDFLSGQRMGASTVSHLRAFALSTFLATVTAFLLSGVMRWAMGVFDDAPLWTHLGFSFTHAAVLFMTGIVFVATHLIEEGYQYKRDLEDYV